METSTLPRLSPRPEAAPAAPRTDPAEICPHPLTEEEVSTSRRTQGDNRLSRKPGKPFWRQFLANLGDPVIRILLCALALNLLFAFRGTDWFETGGIALAVFLAALISTLSEYGSEAAFEKLSEACARTVSRVRRRVGGRGTLLEVPMEEVVCGDVVVLSAGESVPADGLLLSGLLTVDQSAMTGESREVEKTPVRIGRGGTVTVPAALSPADPHALLRGCVLVGGQGELLVTRVGDRTFLGEISDEVQTDKRDSPLKLRLTRLAQQISRLGYIAAALVTLIFLVNALFFDSGFDRSVILSKLSDWRYMWDVLFHALTLGLTVLVVAVPEGLPMMIAVVLSANIRRMAKDQVLVRKPAGIEAAGSMNILFTDKTGTLTRGLPSVGRVLLGDGTEVSDFSALASGYPLLWQTVADACMTNTQSRPGREGAGGDDGSPLRALGGNATDRALMDGVLVRGLPKGLSAVTDSLPFDSARKTAAALVRRPDGRDCLYVKGAPERLLPRVTDTLRADGSPAPVDRAALAARIDAMTAKGGRVLLLCLREMPSGSPMTAASSVQAASPGQAALAASESGPLTLLCAVLLTDRLRKEAPEAVRTLRRAGVHVVMMTGDNKDTARSVARSCGILGGGVDIVLESGELAAMTDNRLRELLPRIGVIARALPTDKSRLVRLSQEADMVVGMTGDGINDAPALKRADIGFAMGAGTQVAKEAGDIIIMDNDLSSIAKAVLYGRTVFTSIRKFITLQLTMNLCAVGVSMIGPFLGVDAPVTVVQMLWINLIMDTLGGLAFAGEAPLASCMREAPKRRDEPILNRYMVHEICLQGGFTVCLCLLFLKSPVIVSHFRSSPDGIYHLTAFFVLFIFSSVFNCFNARTDRLDLFSGLARNRTFMFIMTAVLLIQILFVYLGGAVLRTAPLTLAELGYTLLWSLTVFPSELLRKIMWRLRGKGNGY
ncbi:MAG: calcium-translocating P-type ATPase, PMCA-type [Clostridia bacterium]|nr:calcium-translocating P-type ATPase, PMCA-type [Clostridia bacterium]